MKWSTCSGGSGFRPWAGWPFWAPMRRPVGCLRAGLGACGGLAEGGREELVLLRLSLCSSSRTRRANWFTCHWLRRSFCSTNLRRLCRELAEGGGEELVLLRLSLCSSSRTRRANWFTCHWLRRSFCSTNLRRLCRRRLRFHKTAHCLQPSRGWRSCSVTFLSLP